MVIEKEHKVNLMKELRLHETDTGSPEVQIGLLTEKINKLSEHLKEHKKDQRGANAPELIKKAKDLVDEGKKVEGAEEACKKCLAMNDAYLIEWNAILNKGTVKANSK